MLFGKYGDLRWKKNTAFLVSQGYGLQAKEVASSKNCFPPKSLKVKPVSRQFPSERTTTNNVRQWSYWGWVPWYLSPSFDSPNTLPDTLSVRVSHTSREIGTHRYCCRTEFETQIEQLSQETGGKNKGKYKTALQIWGRKKNWLYLGNGKTKYKEEKIFEDK